MKNLKMNYDLQLFADGGEGGTGGQPGNTAGQQTAAGTGNGTQTNTGTTYTYEQAEEIASARAHRAETAALKSYFSQQGMSETEVKQAVEEYRQKKESQKPNVTAIEKERDDAISKVKQFENEKILSSLHVKGEDLDYVNFKVNLLVTDKKDFKTAAAEFIKENPKYSGTAAPYRVSTGTQSSGTGTTQDTNDFINSAIRKAAGK